MSLSYAFNYNDFAKHAAKQNLSPADKQMKYQSMLSDSAHQREIMDLKAAGLNPVLSANGGSGASTPTGVLDDSMSSGSGGSGGSAKTAKKKQSHTDKLTKALVKTSDSTAKAVSKTAEAVQDIARENNRPSATYDNAAARMAALEIMNAEPDEKHVSGHPTGSHHLLSLHQKNSENHKNNGDSVYPYSLYYDWYPGKRIIRAAGKMFGKDVPHYEYELSKSFNSSKFGREYRKLIHDLTYHDMPYIDSRTAHRGHSGSW